MSKLQGVRFTNTVELVEDTSCGVATRNSSSYAGSRAILFNVERFVHLSRARRIIIRTARSPTVVSTTTVILQKSEVASLIICVPNLADQVDFLEAAWVNTFSIEEEEALESTNLKGDDVKW